VRRFQKEGRTIVFVTHAVDLVRQICDRAVLLDKGEIVLDGHPIDVISRFRGAMHEGRLSANPEERGTREAEVTQFAVLDSAGKPASKVNSGDSLRIVIDVHPNAVLEDVAVGFAISDERDQLVYRTDTGKTRASVAPLSRPIQVEFEIPSLPMLDGRYSVSLGLHNIERTVEYHWMERAHKFEIRSKGEAEGLIFLGAVCRITELQTAKASSGKL
jgi:ABC-2 type transport system ATP-binding protein